MSVSAEFRILIGTLAFASFLASSSIISAEPEAKSITILLGEQNPAGCQLLGKVTGSSHNNKINGDNASYIDRLTAARNNLRDEAYKLGGNTVHVRHVSNFGKYEIPGADKEITFAGNAYYCE